MLVLLVVMVDYWAAGRRARAEEPWGAGFDFFCF